MSVVAVDGSPRVVGKPIDQRHRLRSAGVVGLIAGICLLAVGTSSVLAGGADHSLSFRRTAARAIAHELVARDGIAGDRFGDSLALSADGRVALVGNWCHPKNAATQQCGPGSAYIFSGKNYSVQTELRSGDGTDKSYFGSAVALSGDGRLALVGAYCQPGNQATDKCGQGAAYIFSGAHHGSKVKLTPPANQPVSANFGRAVALSENGKVAMVSAPFESLGGKSEAGVVYVYTGKRFRRRVELTARDAASGDLLGYGTMGLSADGRTAVLGAPGKSVRGKVAAGVVYVFSGRHYSLQTELMARGQVYDFLGNRTAVSANGSIVLAGAQSRTVDGKKASGVAYVFSGAHFDTQRMVMAKDGSAGDEFGIVLTLSADGSTFLVGAPFKTVDGYSGAGAAYMFAGPGHRTETEFTANDAGPDNSFGIATALTVHGKFALIGAPGHDAGTGAAYLFHPAVAHPSPQAASAIPDAIFPAERGPSRPARTSVAATQ